MHKGLNRVSLGLACAAALAIIVCRPTNVSAQGQMGGYAIYSDWNVIMETGQVVGLGSAVQTASSACYH